MPNTARGSIEVMPDESSTTLARPAATPLRAITHELRRPSHWLQLMRFAMVGASGYLINVAVYALALHAGLDYRAAAVAAFLVAVVNNFAWNRFWTFRAPASYWRGQALRFLVVSTAAFLVSLVVLTLLVRDAGIAKLPAEAVAVLAVTPLSFLANKLWSFRTASA